MKNCEHCGGEFEPIKRGAGQAADYLDAHNAHTRYSAEIAKRLQIPTI